MYDQRVWVAFQLKAWFDRSIQLKWFEEVAAPFIKEEYSDDDAILETLGLYDSLDASKCAAFVDRAAALNHRVGHEPTRETEHWQPIDFGGVGKVLKDLLRWEQDAWLLMLHNWKKWSEGKSSASERRALLTIWAGAAWEKLTTDTR